MQSNECKVQGINHFLQSTIYASVCTAQDTIGHLCCWNMLLACAPLLLAPAETFLQSSSPICLSPASIIPRAYSFPGAGLGVGPCWVWGSCQLTPPAFLNGSSADKCVDWWCNEVLRLQVVRIWVEVLANRIFRAQQYYGKWLLRLVIISKVFLLSWSSAAVYGVIYSLIRAFAQDGIAETITTWSRFHSDFCSLPEESERATIELNYCWSKKN